MDQTEPSFYNGTELHSKAFCIVVFHNAGVWSTIQNNVYIVFVMSYISHRNCNMTFSSPRWWSHHISTCLVASWLPQIDKWPSCFTLFCAPVNRSCQILCLPRLGSCLNSRLVWINRSKFHTIVENIRYYWQVSSSTKFSQITSSDSIWLDWLVGSATQWGPSQFSREFRWLEGSPNFYRLLIIVPIAILYLRSLYIGRWGSGKRNIVFISINSHSTLILGQQPTKDRRCCPRNTYHFYSRHYALMTFPVKLRNMSTCFGICNLSYYSSGTILMISFDNDCLCIEGKITEHL